MLADMGATVIRVDRSENVKEGAKPSTDVMLRGRHSIGLDLKKPEAIETVLRLIEKADGLFEGFRPGVTERLGLGPDVCLARNPRLVYGRMTGWGQEGPYAQAAGHDINYISLSGALAPIGRKGGGPVPPINFVGDFGGGGMFLAYGMVCALLEAQRSGKGQVVDAAMVDGSATLATFMFPAVAAGAWNLERGTNMLDSGAPFYDAYECADGQYVSVGSIEPQFYALLRQLAGLTDPKWDRQNDRALWPELKGEITKVFLTKTRAEWCEIMEHTDVCFAPVLNIVEATKHPHAIARKAHTEVAGIVQPSPAPRLSRTPGAIQSAPPVAGQHTADVLSAFGFGADEIASLKASGAAR